MTGLLSLLATVTAGPVEFPLGPRIVFWVLCALTLGGALCTVTRRNLVAAAMALVATFFGLAGLYAMLQAHFLAAIQVLVYAGGIMVLFVFVVMVLNREEAEPWALRNVLGVSLGLASIVYLTARMMQLLWQAGPEGTEAALRLRMAPGAPPQDFGTVARMGDYFFQDFLFPFEAVSILLVIAIIGAVVLARSTVARATSVHEIPEGEIDTRQPQHGASDEVVGVLVHGGHSHKAIDGGGH